jgi:hypothetical protein
LYTFIVFVDLLVIVNWQAASVTDNVVKVFAILPFDIWSHEGTSDLIESLADLGTLLVESRVSLIMPIAA